MNRIVEHSPYTPPKLGPETSVTSPPFDRRFLFLLLPPLIPLAVHFTTRMFIPSDETLYLALFSLAAIIPAWIWSLSMIDRLRLPFWKSYCLACCVWLAVFVSAILSPKLLVWTVGWTL
jgi:hypothetical protein